MRVSYLWLKSLVDFSESPEEIAEILTMTGLEVESLEPVGPELDGITIAHVLEVKPHPNADKLTLCKVDLGDSVAEVVCGAPNVQAGQKVPYIGAGTKLPSGLVIEERKVRGVLSRGMICSEVELGLGGDASGIMVLDADAPVGNPMRNLYGPQDWAMELEVTINRPDCLSHVGVAREIAAALGLRFHPPEFSIVEEGPPIETLTSIKILEPKLGPRYSARIIQGIKVGPSPDWMRLRLEAAGLRAINNVVDVTNYVMLEMGHPMHAFDFNLLEEGRIEVRCGKTGDTFTTLDEMDRRLDDRMLLICDGKRGVALAGVMGGLNSEIREDTKDLLLESAYFDPINTRRTSSLLNLTTDSSKRFERGADPNATIRALDMAASMILELAGGKIAKGVADAYPEPIEPWQVELRPQRVASILGVDVPKQEMKEHLVRLGCEVKGSDPFAVTVPTFRPDLEREIDLIEEVARLHGYEKVPAADRAAISFTVAESPVEIFQTKLVDHLVKLGFCQSVSSPMIAEKEARLPGHPAVVKIRNPGSEDMAVLRNGLLPGLLKTAAHNINRDMPDLRIFEIGRVFCQDGDTYKEWDAVGAVFVGIHEPERWDQEPSSVGFLDVKGVVELMLAEFLLDKLNIIYYNNGGDTCYTADSAVLNDGERNIGIYGQLHPGTAVVFDIEVPIFAFELDLSTLHGAATERRSYHAFPKYPALQRDLAFVVDENVTAGDLQQCILSSGGENLERCNLFDVYRADQIGLNKKSLAFRLSFQSAERTLTDDEADGFIGNIITAVEKKFGAKLRS